MLETARSNGGQPSLEQVFSRGGAQLRRVAGEDNLFLVSDSRVGGPAALLEMLEDRHPVLYTLLETRQSDPWVRRLVDGTPWLDRLWLSGAMFGRLWDLVKRTSSPRRYTKLSFEYEARFEPGELPDLEDDSVEDAGTSNLEEPQEYRRGSRFTMVDRIEAVAEKLPDLQSTYRPLLSTTQLRIPAAGRGGHDFYFDGKVTNRADSFLDHRQTVGLVLRMYRLATEVTEHALWISLEEGNKLTGAPVYMQFSEELDRPLFERWIDSTFDPRGNRFRLGGKPFRLSPGKVHVYGIDRHLWQPLSLELTTHHVTGFLPQGTCGNTVHRLVTNVQRFVDPGVRAWVGEQPYEALVGSALSQAAT